MVNFVFADVATMKIDRKRGLKRLHVYKDSENLLAWGLFCFKISLDLLNLPD